jgi:enoyl-CoA hydratase/carnithine racemase
MQTGGMSRHITIEKHGEIALLTVDRPPANAMSPDLLAEGRAAAREAEQSGAGAVVIAGRPRYFSAGLDLKIAPTLDADGQRGLVRGINELFAAWFAFPRPVVCAVTGHAIAGGLILALCGDWRVVGQSGRFGLTELRAGIPYPAVASAVVRHELSAPVARELMLRADLIDASHALRLGVFDEQVPDDEVVERALVVAAEMAALPAAAFWKTKRDLRGAAIKSLDELIRSDDNAGDWIEDDAGQRATRLLGG